MSDTPTGNDLRQWFVVLWDSAASVLPEGPVYDDRGQAERAQARPAGARGSSRW